MDKKASGGQEWGSALGGSAGRGPSSCCTPARGPGGQAGTAQPPSESAADLLQRPCARPTPPHPPHHENSVILASRCFLILFITFFPHAIKIFINIFLLKCRKYRTIFSVIFEDRMTYPSKLFRIHVDLQR